MHKDRPRLSVKSELALALLPTLTVLIVFALVEAFSRQRLLFASLASSAFLIYRDPQHGMNAARTVVVAQIGAALFGFVIYLLLGPTLWHPPSRECRRRGELPRPTRVSDYGVGIGRARRTWTYQPPRKTVNYSSE